MGKHRKVHLVSHRTMKVIAARDYRVLFLSVNTSDIYCTMCCSSTLMFLAKSPSKNRMH